jgi:hypothetical protein
VLAGFDVCDAVYAGIVAMNLENNAKAALSGKVCFYGFDAYMFVG